MAYYRTGGSVRPELKKASEWEEYKALGDVIPGWISYRFHYSVSLPSSRVYGLATPSFQYPREPEPKPYEGHISTPTEKLLMWQPMAITIMFLALLVSIAVW